MRPAHATLVLITLIGLAGAGSMVFVIYGAWKGVAGPRGEAQTYARSAAHAICGSWDPAEYRKRATETGNQMFGDADLKQIMENGQAQFGKLGRIQWTRAGALSPAKEYSREEGAFVQITLDCRFSKSDHQRIDLWCVEHVGKWKLAGIWFPGLSLPSRIHRPRFASVTD